MDSSPEIPPAIDRETIAAAQRRIAADVRRTPLWRLPGAALGLDVAELWLKLEQLQLGGSFKARGMFNRMRALALQGTALASAQVDTLRIKLLKVAAVVTRNTRRIRLYLASHWPSADIFAHVMNQLRSP